MTLTAAYSYTGIPVSITHYRNTNATLLAISKKGVNHIQPLNENEIKTLKLMLEPLVLNRLFSLWRIEGVLCHSEGKPIEATYNYTLSDLVATGTLKVLSLWTLSPWQNTFEPLERVRRENLYDYIKGMPRVDVADFVTLSAESNSISNLALLEAYKSAESLTVLDGFSGLQLLDIEPLDIAPEVFLEAYDCYKARH